MPDSMPHSLRFRAVNGDFGSTTFAAIFAEYWPAYRRWMRRAPQFPLDTCVESLRAHMPELMPTFEQLLQAFGGGEDLARFLSQYCPPRVVRGCSQLICNSDDGPVLLRSYDHHPKLFDAVVLTSRWSNTSTLALTDCLWGALDGINEHGLAVALAFGGENAVGPGFAAPLVVRYLLETCSTVAEATAALERVPVYMPYTFVIVDARGEFITAFAHPDQPTRLVKRRTSTNHQGAVVWPAYCAQARSVERLHALESLLESPADITKCREAFLHPPLWREEYARAFGTLYIAEYHPWDCSLTLFWPARTERFEVHQNAPRAFSLPLPRGSA